MVVGAENAGIRAGVLCNAIKAEVKLLLDQMTPLNRKDENMNLRIQIDALLDQMPQLPKMEST